MLLNLFHNQGKGQPVGGELSYAQKILNIDRNNLIAYWPLWEANGANAGNHEGTIARDGTYKGSVSLGESGIGDGRTSTLFDPAGSERVNVYSTSLRDAFNPQEITLIMWHKVSGSGVWTDGQQRRLLSLRTDGNNQVRLLKDSSNNTLSYVYTAGGTADTVDHTTSSTAWMCLAFTISSTNNQIIAYFNGAQTGSIQTGVGAWSGDLGANLCNIGTLDDSAPANLIDGWAAHVAIWTAPLSSAQILSMSEV